MCGDERGQEVFEDSGRDLEQDNLEVESSGSETEDYINNLCEGTNRGCCTDIIAQIYVEIFVKI